MTTKHSEQSRELYKLNDFYFPSIRPSLFHHLCQFNKSITTAENKEFINWSRIKAALRANMFSAKALFVHGFHNFKQIKCKSVRRTPTQISILIVGPSKKKHYSWYLSHWQYSLIAISRILLEHQCKCCNLIGWVILRLLKVVYEMASFFLFCFTKVLEKNLDATE